MSFSLVRTKNAQLEWVKSLKFGIGGPRAFHRADIQEVLINNASSTIRFHFSHRLVKYTKISDEIELLFVNGHQVTCDLLFGSDGVNSAVRKCFLEDGNGDMKHSSPRWSGTNVYRCLIEAKDIRKDAPDHPGLGRPTVVCCFIGECESVCTNNIFKKSIAGKTRYFHACYIMFCTNFIAAYRCVPNIKG